MSHLPSHYTDDKLIQAPPRMKLLLMIILLFSYTTLFVSLIPIIPIIVGFSLMITAKFEAIQYLTKYYRQVPVMMIEFECILPMLNLISILSVTTNASIFVLTSGYFQENVLILFNGFSAWSVRVVIVVSWHIIVFVLVGIVKAFYPQVSAHVQSAEMRQYALKEELLMRVSKAEIKTEELVIGLTD